MTRGRFTALAVLAAIGAAATGTAAGWLVNDFGTLDQTRPAITDVVEEAVSAQEASLPPSVVASTPAPPPPRHPGLVGTENILIAGIDRRPGEKGGGLTDTLILVVRERQSGEVGLISIPRDMAVELPDQGFQRINAAYGLAYARGARPLEALKKAVGDLMALPVEHAVVIDLSVFERLVEALGGVSVDVPCPIIDDFVDVRTPTGRRILDVQAGRIRMDGPTAAMYVRSRHGRSDFSRARRQQAVLSGIHRQLLNLGSLGQLPDALSAVERSVSTDLKRYQLLDLARQALSLDTSRLHGMVFSDAEAEPRRDRGRAMLFPNVSAIDRSVGRLFSSPPPGVTPSAQVCPPADAALQKRHRSVEGAPSPSAAAPKEGRVSRLTRY